MSTSPESQYEKLPIVIKGKFDNIDVVIPFVTIGDANSYIEQIDFATKRLNCSVNLIIYINGVEGGKIIFTPTIH